MHFKQVCTCWELDVKFVGGGEVEAENLVIIYNSCLLGACLPFTYILGCVSCICIHTL